MFVWAKSFIDRIFSVVGAFVFAQMPQFYEVYSQRLAGHLAELSLQIQETTTSAQRSGRSLEEYIQQFLSSNQPEFVNQGEQLQRMVERWDSLNIALQAMQSSTPWTRPYEFFSHLQGSIFQGVMHDFQPGLSLSLEGGIYALIGIVAGSAFFYLINTIIFGFFGWLFGWKKKSEKVVYVSRDKGRQAGVDED